MGTKIRVLAFVFCAILIIKGCAKDPDAGNVTIVDDNTSAKPIDLKIPTNFPDPIIDEDNPLTEEGVALGRRLFYDPILSGNQTQSCADCHNQAWGFTDNGDALSDGIDGTFGDRNSMPIINLVWNRNFFWDGRSNSLEAQALEPVINPIEMHDTWPNAVGKLQDHAEYPKLFEKAFGTSVIDSQMVADAIAQFEKTLISGNSRFDASQRFEIQLTPDEINGMVIFNTEKGDCFHCHGSILFTDNEFHNNGLDSAFADPGLAKITGDPNDLGKFKTPTLRNIEFTAPYMHDGRFETLEEVIDFYSEGLKNSATIDPLMKKVNFGGVELTPLEKQQLLAFLKALSDPEFINNPDFSDPNP